MDGEGDGYHLYTGTDDDEVPRDVTRVRVDDSVTVIHEGAFEGCLDLQEVELPDGLLVISGSAFARCRSLARIAIPSTVTEIGIRAFEDCSSFEEVVLPDGLGRVGREAFSHCTSLQRINIPPIERIEHGTFNSCANLTEVTLPEGICEIGDDAFSRCTSLKSIHLPSSLTVIGFRAFNYCVKLTGVSLPEQVTSAKPGAFGGCNFQNFRVPPAMREVDLNMFLYGCTRMVSLEIPVSVEQVEDSSYNPAYGAGLESLRNVAIPPTCRLGSSLISGCEDLKKVLPNGNNRSAKALQHRFDVLPIHEMCYYSSYHPAPAVMSDLRQGIGTSRTLNASGKQQDCLGMTPLHILACSTKPVLEMFQLLVKKYPESLVMADKWGCIPLVYAFWCNAPNEIINFLLESHKNLFPDHEMDWNGMIVTLVKARKPLSNIRDVINAQRERFPDQSCDLQAIVVELTESESSFPKFRMSSIPFGLLMFLLQDSISDRIDSLDVGRWREEMQNRVNSLSAVEARLRGEYVKALYARLDSYKEMKEGSWVLELALWTAKIDESSSGKCQSLSQKRARVGDAIGHKELCRINCGANIVIPNVLSYLHPN